MPMGSYGGGGAPSSSWSNLSPLAPPFMLDKSFNSPHPSPSANFTAPSYATILDQPVSAWNPLRQSSPGSNYSETGSRSTTYQRSFEAYKPPDLQAEKGSASGLLSLNSLTKSVYDELAYEPYPDAVPVSLVGTDPYHAPYSIPAPTSDHNLMVHSEPNYDLLTSFGTGPQGVYTNVDDTMSVTGVHYTPHWNGLWNGLNDADRGKWLDLGGTFGTKNTKSSSDSLTANINVDQGHYAFGGSTSFSETPSVSTTHSQHFGRENHFGYLGIKECESVDEAKASTHAPSFAKVPTVVSRNSSKGNPNPQKPIRDSFFKEDYNCADSSHTQTSYASSYVFDSVPAMSYLPPPAVPEVAFSGFTSAEYPFYSTKSTGFTSSECPFYAAKSIVAGNDVVDKPKNHPEHAHFGQKEPYLTLGFGCQVSDKAGVADSLFPGSACTKPGKALQKKLDNEAGFAELFTTQSASEASQLRTPDFLKSQIDYSVEKYSDDADVQNTAEDSPCWKGAPSDRFSPFEDSTMLSSELVVEKLELVNNMRTEVLENELMKTTGSVKEGSGNVNQTANKTALEPSCISAGRDGSQAATQRLFRFGLSDTDRLCFRNKFKTDNGSESSQTKLLNFEYHEDELGKKFSSPLVTNVVEDRECDNVVSLGVSSVAPTTAQQNIPKSPAAEEAFSKLEQLPMKDLDVKLDIGMLVNSMKSMSELLFFHCSSNPAADLEMNREALKSTISNLDSCLVREIDPSLPTEQSGPPRENVPSAHEVKKVPAIDADQHGHDILKIPKCDILKWKSKDLLDPLSIKDGVTKDDEIVEAIKSVLVEYLPCEDEMHDKPCLYKNLWLEAEAVLCVTSSRARLSRLKGEIAKSTSQKMNAVDSILSPRLPTDVNKVGNQVQKETVESPKTNDVENAIGSLVSPERVQSCKTNDVEKVVGSFVSSEVQLLSSDDRNSSVIDGGNHESCGSFRNTDPEGSESSVLAGGLNAFKSLQNSNLSKLGEPKLPVPERQGFVPSVGSQNVADDAESSIMSRFKILISRADHLSSLKTNGTTSSPNENGSCPPTLHHSTEDSFFSSPSSYESEIGGGGDGDHNNIGNDPEAGVMARFNILKNRMTVQQQMKNDDGSRFEGWLQSTKKSSGVNGNLCTSKHGENDLKDHGVEVDVAASKDQAVKAHRMGGELLEGWYDCNATDWEHIVKEDLARQK